MNKTKLVKAIIIFILIFFISGFAEPVLWNWYQNKFSLKHDEMLMPFFMLIFYFSGLIILIAAMINKLFIK